MQKIQKIQFEIIFAQSLWSWLSEKGKGFYFYLATKTKSAWILSTERKKCYSCTFVYSSAKNYINRKGKKITRNVCFGLLIFSQYFTLKVVFWLHSTGNCNAPTLNQQKWELCEKESSSLIGGDVANQRAALAADRPRNHSLSSAYNLCCLGQKGGNWVKWTFSNLHFALRVFAWFWF